LAGTQDQSMRAELQRMSGPDDHNPLVRATALNALAYSRNDDDYYLIEDALGSTNATLKMGAMEAVEVGRFQAAIPTLVSIANADPSPALQVYALKILCQFGNDTGHSLLITRIGDPDWPARAMAFWYLGRYGNNDDYTMILSRLPTETNPFVLAEICLAALRLAPVEGQ
jgi:hypothetical protein